MVKKVLKPYQSSKYPIVFDENDLKSVQAYVDENVLKYAVTNLITNAMKFAEAQIRLSVTLDASEFSIHIDDDGRGLPSEDAERLFYEYATAVDGGSGDKHIGLGLAIVKKVVTLHKGTVMATKSPLLKGARFTISIPLCWNKELLRTMLRLSAFVGFQQ